VGWVWRGVAADNPALGRAINYTPLPLLLEGILSDDCYVRCFQWIADQVRNDALCGGRFSRASHSRQPPFTIHYLALTFYDN